ncbi:sensor histidine kinase [Streptomyces sp. NPDC055607]
MTEVSGAGRDAPDSLGWPWNKVYGNGGLPEAATMTESVEAVFEHSAAATRALWAVLVLVTVAGPSFFITPLPPAAWPVVAAGVSWSAFVWCQSRRRYRLGRQMAYMDVAFFATALLGQSSLVPAPLVGDGTNWVFAGASLSVFAACLLLRPLEAAGATALMVTAYLAGIVAAGGSALHPDGPTTSFILVVQCTVGVLAVRTLRLTAGRADEALDREVADQHVIIVETQRERELEAQERLLHDKVRSTLWLVGGGHLRDLRQTALESCRESLAALRDLREGRLASQMSRSPLHAVDSAVQWARSAGLQVVTDASRNGGGDATTRHAVDEEDVPAAVSEAIGEAVRQALANIIRHARTGRAWVALVTGPEGVKVTVHDQGRGFAFASMGPAGRGVRGSIVGRMRDVGGDAHVRSGVGQGTTVTLKWQFSADRGAAGASGGQNALRLYGISFLRLMITVGLVYHGLSLYAAVHFSRDYAVPVLTVMAWSVQLGVGALLVAGVRGVRLPHHVVWLCMVATLLASATVVINCRAEGMLGFANWAFGDTVWALSLAALHLRIGHVALALGLHDLLHVVVIALKAGGHVPDLLKLSAILLQNALLQVGFALGFMILVRITSVTARAVVDSGKLAAKIQSQHEAHRSREARAAAFDSQIYALLTSMSEGDLDPADASVQRLFYTAGMSLRLEDALSRSDSAAAGLALLAERATAHGVHLEVELAENFDRFPEAVRQPMLAVMATALKFASPGKALLVFHSHMDMTLRDWEGVEADWHEAVHSVTLSHRASHAEAPLLRAQVDRAAAAYGLRLDLDLFSDDARASAGTHVFLAVAGRE